MIDKRNETTNRIDARHLLTTRLASASRAIAAVLLLACAALPALAQTGGPVVENDRIKVWDVTLTPKQPLALEKKEHDSFLLVFDGGKIRSTDAGGKTTTATRKFADTIFIPKGTQETEEVVSDKPARVYLVEFKADATQTLPNQSGLVLAYPRPGSKKTFENGRLVIWDYTFKLGVQTATHFHDKDALVIYHDDGSIQSTTQDGKSVVADDKAGQAKFNPAGRIHYEKLVKGQQEHVIVAELK